MSRYTQALISLPNLRHNIDVLRRHLATGTEYLAIVKANAYGHGMEQVARCALSHGAAMLGVAFFEEGLRLRRAGIQAPILLLGACEADNFEAAIAHDLTLTVFDVETLHKLQHCAKQLGKTCHIHIKVDTGMRRIGFVTHEAFSAALDALRTCPHVALLGLFTHFATSESEDQQFTLLQGERFRSFVAIVHAQGFRPLIHAANSGAILGQPDLQFDMVRGGIAMYGYHPIGHSVESVPLKPVLSLVTRIVMIKDLAPGEGVSYGLTFVAQRRMRIATLPVGYGDGYPRLLSNRASVLVHGVRVPQIGTICMDQMLIDISHIPDAATWDEVVLIGTQGKEQITADEIASLTGTISYEILLGIDLRVPRIYIE